MLFLEYQAKNLLSDAGVKIPQGELVDDTYEFRSEVILKAQVPTGNRGKHGGVVKVAETNDLRKEVERLKNLEINGYKPEAILAEELLKFDREHYFSLLIDYKTEEIRLLARAHGGVDVEEMEDEILSMTVSPENLDKTAEKLCEFYGYDISEKKEFSKFLNDTFNCFVANDTFLLEINPLVIVDQALVALDCKMEVDDNALFRHHELVAHSPDANFVMLNPNGITAIIANGAGLAMATVDQVNEAGLIATNFLDIGGGADATAITKQLTRLSGLPNLKAIIVNIFAGITHCDQVAEAMVAARDGIEDLPPLFIRLHGTNYSEAKVVLDRAGIKLFQSLNHCIEAAKNV